MKRVGLIIAICLLITLLPVPAEAAQPQPPGKSALLMDMTTGTVLYEKNAHMPLPPASVTKVMTLLLVMEAIDSGRLRWDDPVVASEAAAAKGGSQIYLKVGEAMTVSDMVKAVAVSSANDCACALAEQLAGSEAAFVEKMNQRAKQLGMQDTVFVNCTGLDDEENAKTHLTSAYDIALMSRELMQNHPDIQKYTTIWMDTVRDGSFGLANTNKLVRFYPGATGLKTGFTSAAGYCLSATAERDGLALIAVVLGAQSSQERFAACKALLDYGFANYALVCPRAPRAEVCVELGKKSLITAVPAEPVQLLIDKGQAEQVTLELRLEETVAAPVSKGQRLGILTVKVGQQVLRQIPMVAQEGIPRLCFWDILWQLLREIAMGKAG